MQRIQIGPWEIEYDREATRAAYAAMSSDGYCDCKSCRNYLANTRAFPEEVRQFFDSLGIDPAKPYEMSSAVPPPPCDEPLYYEPVWYHCVGHVISGPPDNCSFIILNTETAHVVYKDFSVAFMPKCTWPPEMIPEEQALELVISIVLPWALDEPYEYSQED